MAKAIQYGLAVALVAAICFLELLHPFAHFRVATLTALFVLFADLAWIAAGAARNVLTVAASLMLGLAVAEGAASISPPGREISIVDSHWSIRQPIIGWGPAKPGVVHAAMRDARDNSIIYDAHYTIDSDLLRHTVSAESGPTVVFFGDSYTFGDGVEDSETLPQSLADLYGRKLRVINLAFTGYSPAQFLREMETGRFDRAIGAQPKLFVFLTAPWHAERTSCKAYWTAHAPLYAAENGRVVFKGDCNEGASLLWREWLGNSALYSRLVDPWRHKISHDDVELYVRTLEAAVKMARGKYGVPTAIPYLRVPKQYLAGTGFTDDEIMQRLSDAGAIVIDASLKDEEAAGHQISIRIDGHPTAYANLMRARQIKDAIDKNPSAIVLSDAK